MRLKVASLYPWNLVPPQVQWMTTGSRGSCTDWAAAAPQKTSMLVAYDALSAGWQLDQSY